MSIMRKILERELKEHIATYMCVSPESLDIKDDTILLGFVGDSLDFIELSIELEDTYDISIPQGHAITTFKDLVDFIFDETLRVK